MCSCNMCLKQKIGTSPTLCCLSFFIVAGKHHHLHVEEHRWPTLTSKRKLSETLTVFLCVTGSSSLHLLALLKPTSSVHSHNFGDVFANCLSIPTYTPSKLGCKLFSFRASFKMEQLSTHNARNQGPHLLGMAARSFILSQVI